MTEQEINAEIQRISEQSNEMLKMFDQFLDVDFTNKYSGKEKSKKLDEVMAYLEENTKNLK